MKAFDKTFSGEGSQMGKKYIFSQLSQCQNAYADLVWINHQKKKKAIDLFLQEQTECLY